jgi:protein TonB
MTTLLESKSRPFGSTKGVAMSMVIHGTIFAGIVFGTARAVLPPREKIEEHPVLYVAAPPPPEVHVAPEPLPVVKTPPKTAAQRVEAPRPKVPQPKPIVAPTPAIVAPAKVAISIPTVDIKSVPVSIDVSPVIAEPARPSSDLSGTSSRKAGDADAEGSSRGKSGLGSGNAGKAYDENQVDRTVEVTRASDPRYPEALRSVNVEGAVVMRFIVSASGHVEPGSIEVVSTPHKLFGDAVRVALLNTRYRPAEAAGHSVRQLVEQTFHFRLGKDG